MDGLQQENVENVKLKHKDIPIVRELLLKQQEGVCPLCSTEIQPGQATLDHNHAKTGEAAGAVRDVLCRNCNGIEGRIYNLVIRARRGKDSFAFVLRLLDYWRRHTKNVHGYVHPKHTPPKKRGRKKGK